MSSGIASEPVNLLMGDCPSSHKWKWLYFLSWSFQANYQSIVPITSCHCFSYTINVCKFDNMCVIGNCITIPYYYLITHYQLNGLACIYYTLLIAQPMSKREVKTLTNWFGPISNAFIRNNNRITNWINRWVYFFTFVFITHKFARNNTSSPKGTNFSSVPWWFWKMMVVLDGRLQGGRSDQKTTPTYLIV